MRFTRNALAALSLPSEKPYLIFWDSELPGFGIRLNPTGKVWVVQYRIAGKTRRETIGRVESISLEAARDRAKDTLARVRLGDDPHAERAEAKVQRALTFQIVAERYLKGAVGRLKPRSYDEVARHLSSDWRLFAELPVQRISRAMIAARIEDISLSSGPIAANRARATLSALYTFALGVGLVDQNPVIGTPKPGLEVKRDHVLPTRDIVALWRASENFDYGRIIKLLVLTGQRRDEAGNILWSEIDFENAIWTLPPERTKNRRSHEVPLSKQSLAVLKSSPRILGRDHVFGSGKRGFSGWSKAKTKLDKRIALVSVVKSWRIHDLRRTAATGMATLGVAPHVVEAVLNHVSGSKAGVAGIYNRATYRDEKRAALELWGNLIESLTS